MENIERDCKVLVTYGVIFASFGKTSASIVTSDGGSLEVDNVKYPTWLLVKPISHSLNDLSPRIRQMEVKQTSASICEVEVILKNGTKHKFSSPFKLIKLVME